VSRGLKSNRRLVENAACLTIQFLREHKALPGPSTGAGDSILSYQGQKIPWVFTFSITTNGGRLTFEYDYQGKHYIDGHTIIAEPVYFGGHRYFFRCTHCQRRVKALYWGGNAWGCRFCCKLVYKSSRNSHTLMELFDKSQKAERNAATLKRQGHPRLARKMIYKTIELQIKHDEVMDALCMKRFGHHF